MAAIFLSKFQQKEEKNMTDILNKVRKLYEAGVTSPSYQAWRKEALEAWRFYDGDQWSDEEKSKLAENGQPAIVINKIAPKVDNITGSEIAGRTRVVYRSRSGDKGEEQTASALSDLALYVAERNDQAIEISRVFKSGLVTGIGWMDVGVEDAEEGAFIFNRFEDEMQVVFDPNSKRMDYSDARFVARERWLDADDLQRMFPEQSGKLIEKLGKQGALQNTTPHFTLKATNEVNYVDYGRDVVRVVEVQYKQTEKQYAVTTNLGKTFTTFDKKTAYANAENSVETSFVSRVYMAYYSDDSLLSHTALPYQHNRFTLVPYIFKRSNKDGRPYGMVRSALDPQRELNKRRSKAMHLLNTSQVIADVDAVEDPNILAREAARPDGIILKRPGKDLRILRNTDLASSQVSVMESAARDIQDVMGVFDEAIGKHTNATSGTAIRQRQVASNQNQMFAFDALRRTKKQLGTLVLSLIREFFSTEMVIQITDNLSAPRLVRLNQPVVDTQGNSVRDENGEVVKANDVQTGVFDIHVEEVRDALSSRDLELEELQLLMQSGVPIPPQMLVEATSVRKKEEILKSLKSNNQGDGQQ